MIQKVHLKIVCHSENAEQKSMILLLMKQNISILQCLCTIWLNIAIIILILHEVYGSLKEMKQKNVNLTVDNNHIPNNSSSFKYKSSLTTNRNGLKIAVLRAVYFGWGFNFYDNWCKTLCSNGYFINRRQCKIIKTIKRRI